MGNSQTKEARGELSHQENGAVSSGHRSQHSNEQSSHRAQPPRRGSRPDFSSLLGIGSNEPDVASLEARRESKAEREQRKQEKEKQARIKERERSMREEHVDGGYLVTQGVYVGPEDYNKATVRQLMIERRLAPFWRGLDNFSGTWAEHQIMAAARGMPIPPADEVPPELEYQLSKRPSQDASKSLAIPTTSRTESYQSDSGRASPANGSGTYVYPSSSPQPATSSSVPFRSRAKTLASLGAASRTNSEKDLSPRELKLPHDPFVNGQPIEVFLYKEPLECPICCLDYPPYLNMTRCCEQAICSECFVQIKRPDPHPPEHSEPDPNAPPMSEEERMAQAEGLLVSEVATCPFCKQPEFGITYSGPSFRRGLTYNTPYGVLSARSSQTSVASSNLSPGPGRRRGTSLSATAPEVITTDKIRPDWANKLATARAHAARRSAAASALHAAAYLMNDQGPRPPGGPFSRRNMLRRSTLENAERPSDAQMSALSFLAERQSSYNAGDAVAPRRPSASRRSRMDDLEDMMMMEAIRLSLAAEEERRRKEEKEAKKKAKKEEKELKKADKVARKNSHALSPGTNDPVSMHRTLSEVSSTPVEDAGKGKNAERNDSSPARVQADGMDFASDGIGSSFTETSQESLTQPIGIPSAAEPFKRSHLRQMSNASSASSSYHDPGSNTPPVSEPMFNFQSLAAMIDKDEKENESAHVEHTESSNEKPEGTTASPSHQSQADSDLHSHDRITANRMQVDPLSSSSR